MHCGAARKASNDQRTPTDRRLPNFPDSSASSLVESSCTVFSHRDDADSVPIDAEVLHSEGKASPNRFIQALVPCVQYIYMYTYIYMYIYICIYICEYIYIYSVMYPALSMSPGFPDNLSDISAYSGKQPQKAN